MILRSALDIRILYSQNEIIFITLTFASLQYPSLLSDCFSGVAKDHFLYVFHVRDARSNEYYQPGPGAPFGCVDTFGILTQRRLPMSIVSGYLLRNLKHQGDLPIPMYRLT